jgi:hypothetical protein
MERSLDATPRNARKLGRMQPSSRLYRCMLGLEQDNAISAISEICWDAH